MENSRSSFPPRNADTVVSKALAILTSVPRDGDTIRFSTWVSSAAEKPVLSANCCTVSPAASRNFRTFSPTGISSFLPGSSRSPDSFATFDRTSSIVSSRVYSGKGCPLLQGVDVERDELLVLPRDDLREAVVQRGEFHDSGAGHVRPEGDHRCHLPAPDDVSGDVVRRDGEQPNVAPVHQRPVHQGAVDDQVPSRRHRRKESLQGGPVHDEEGFRAPDDGGPDLLVGDDDGTIRRASPHLDAVSREVGDVPSFLHRGQRQEVPDHQDPLPAEAGHDDVGGHAKSACFRSLKTPSGKYSDISPRTRFCASSGFIPQFVGQVERNSTMENPIPLSCISKAFRTDSLAFRIWAGVDTATRAEYAVPSRPASSSAIRIG